MYNVMHTDVDRDVRVCVCVVSLLSFFLFLVGRYFFL